MGQVLGIVYRAISSHLIGAAGYHHAAGTFRYSPPPGHKPVMFQ